MRVSAVILALVAAASAQDTYTATGVGCEPHDDHWHCPAGVAEPTTAPAAASVDTVSATASGVCEPHGDHWHCPSGVAEPTFAPSAIAATTVASGSITSVPAASASASTSVSHSHDEDDHDHDHEHSATAATCEPHGDHWHCPSGVAEPTTAPAQTVTTSRATTTFASVASGSANAAATQFDGAGSAVSVGQQGILAIVLGAVGAFFL
ncbi:hypothetical protein C7974DRAFT_97882 [Boeremia exigua]|uniref:uncharacterized protein n=1 Tax=Boeremia exigua TaxID=749465 RepID=UPI001E8E3680|nr:uncharacterized protein C7974DRAFT_97882 [Boeremia exigua]KAH6642242.1 hypothetical protein C7974DRAFT_97882 [Boeremia exigua]